VAKVIKDQFYKKKILTWLPFLWKTPWQGGSGKQNRRGDSLAGILKLASLWGRRKGEGSRFAGANTIPPATQGSLPSSVINPPGTTERRKICVEEGVSALALISHNLSLRPFI